MLCVCCVEGCGKVVVAGWFVVDCGGMRFLWWVVVSWLWVGLGWLWGGLWYGARAQVLRKSDHVNLVGWPSNT